MGGKNVTVIIPCYRAERHLKRTVNELLAVLSGATDYDANVVLIDDASPDRTGAVVEELVSENPRTVVGLSLRHNVGQARAKMAGLPFAEGPYAVFMDDDGQHDPRTILDMIRELDRGFDLVYARFHELREPALRRAASRILDLLLCLSCAKQRGLRITSYFAVGPDALEILKTYRSLHPFIGGYLMSKRLAVTTVFSNHRVRSAGGSSYSLRKLCKRAVELCLLWRIPSRNDKEPMYEIGARYVSE